MIVFELKRLAHGSIIYGIGDVLQRFLGLLLLPLFTRVLTPEDYGVIAMIGLISIGLTGLYNLGTGNSMGILYYQEAYQSRKSTIIWSTTILLLLNSTLVTAVLSGLAPYISQLVFQSGQYSFLLCIAFTSLLLVTISQPFYAYLRLEEKATQYVALTLGNSLITTVLSVFLVIVLQWGILGMLLASMLGQIIMIGIIYSIVARKLTFVIDRRLFRPLVRIGFPSIFGLFAFLVIDYADRQMLQRMVGLDQLGIYSLGYSFGMAVLVLVGSFGSAWPPFFMSFINRLEDARSVFGKVLKYYVIGAGLLVAIFFAAAKPLVVILLGPAFHEAYHVIGLVAASYVLKGCYLILLPGICFARKLHWQSGIEWVAAVVNIVLNLLWIPLYGIIGAATATLIGYLTLPVLSWAVSRKYLEVDYPWSEIGKATVGLVVTSIFLFHAAMLESLSLVITISVLTIVGLTFFLAFVVIDSQERKYAVTKILELKRTIYGV